MTFTNDQRRPVNASNKKNSRKGPDLPFGSQDAIQGERRSTVLSSKSLATVVSVSTK